MEFFGYTPSSRPRSDSELRDLRDGAKQLRASARRDRCADPVKAERESRAADQNDADIKAELERRRNV